jgi:mannose-6-phosphate isomerase-like protein (cupin superfamily)
VKSTTIGRPAGIPAAVSYGSIINSGDSFGLVESLVGGTGSCWWTQLVNGMHAAWGLRCVEHVKIPPGASCGTHLHDKAEEIYYILDGTAVMTVNDHEFEVAAGQLITCPLGTTHGIGVPAGAPEPMSFLVVEVFPGSAPPLAQPERYRVRDHLRASEGYRGYQSDDLQLAHVDLARCFTGPWLGFTEIVIPPHDALPPHDRLGPYTLPGRGAEVLFVADGEAEISAGTQVLKGGRGACLAAALGAPVTVRNLSPRQDLRVLSVQGHA